MKMYGVRLDHDDEEFLEIGAEIGLWGTKSEGIRTCVQAMREIVESARKRPEKAPEGQ